VGKTKQLQEKERERINGYGGRGRENSVTLDVTYGGDKEEEAGDMT